MHPRWDSNSGLFSSTSHSVGFISYFFSTSKGTVFLLSGLPCGFLDLGNSVFLVSHVFWWLTRWWGNWMACRIPLTWLIFNPQGLDVFTVVMKIKLQLILCPNSSGLFHGQPLVLCFLPLIIICGASLIIIIIWCKHRASLIVPQAVVSI